MLITKNDVELRNLQEQVQKNKEDIAKHYEIDRTLANFGIKIVGTGTTIDALPDPLTYQGEYGDGYAIGQPGSYNYYIYTRPDPNSGEYENHWLDVGQLGIQGPQGPQGEKGEQGAVGPSSKWYIGPGSPTAGAQYEQYACYLNVTTGWVYYTDDGGQTWITKGSIKGPQGVQGPRGEIGPQGEQGVQGPQGETGDSGGFISIRGILANQSQLPLPATLHDLTAAYLIGNAEPYDLWIQVGENSDTAVWYNAGTFNASTLVQANGQYQTIWNADTKLDKYTNVTTYNQVYVKNANGGEATINVTKQAHPDAVVQRKSDSNITLPLNPASASDAVCQSWVNSQISNKLELIEPASAETDFVTIKKYNDGTYIQQNTIGAYTPADSTKPDFYGVLRSTKGDIRTNMPEASAIVDKTVPNVKYIREHMPYVHTITMDYVGGAYHAVIMNNYSSQINTTNLFKTALSSNNKVVMSVVWDDAGSVSYISANPAVNNIYNNQIEFTGFGYDHISGSNGFTQFTMYLSDVYNITDTVTLFI